MSYVHPHLLPGFFTPSFTPEAKPGSAGEDEIRNRAPGVSLPHSSPGGAQPVAPGFSRSVPAAGAAGAGPPRLVLPAEACLGAPGGHIGPPASQICLSLTSRGSWEEGELAVTPLQAGSSGWQGEAGGREGPLGKGARDELQCQHICANITNYFPHYKHPAGRQGSNQPKLFKIESKIAAQGSQGSRQKGGPAPRTQGPPATSCPCTGPAPAVPTLQLPLSFLLC